MTLVNVSKRSATLFNLSLAFIFLLKLFRGQIYSVLEVVVFIFCTENVFWTHFAAINDIALQMLNSTQMLEHAWEQIGVFLLEKIVYNTTREFMSVTAIVQ